MRWAAAGSQRAPRALHRAAPRPRPEVRLRVLQPRGAPPLHSPSSAGAHAPAPSQLLRPPPALSSRHSARHACTGNSSRLRAADCDSWRAFAQDPTYSDWLRSKCHSASGDLGWRDDPCACTFRSARYGTSPLVCEPDPADASGSDERPHVITSIKINEQQLPAASGVPLALLYSHPRPPLPPPI